MKRIALILIGAIVFGFSTSPVQAIDDRSLWDINKLSEITDPNLMRVLFGYYPRLTYNDDFSYTADNEQEFSLRDFQVLLSPCSSSSAIDPNLQACIEEVSVRKNGTTNWNLASLSPQTLGEPTKTFYKYKYFEVGKPVAVDAVGFRPAGDRASIWKMPTARHSKGDSYLIRAALGGTTVNGDPGNDNVPPRRLSMELVPISTTKTVNTINQDEYKVEEFPKGYEYKIRLRLGVFTKSISGWFFGRIQDQSLDINVSKGYLEMTGKPAIVPMGVTNVISKSQIPQRLLEICMKIASDINCDGNTANNYGRATLYAPDDGADPSILSEYESVPGGVKTVASLSFWNIRSGWATYSAGPSKKQDCSTQSLKEGENSLLGIVSSNASLYQPSPPTWDEIDKSFTFKVSSPHFDEFGKENRGFYTLYLPLTQANCRWGSDASLPKAQVQIVNQNGASSVTTAVATQENGMLRFNISGFTYSSPIIRIRMGQGGFKPVVKTSIKSQSGAKKTVLICAKGETLKQIVAVKPKCPTGYKKK